MNRRGFLGSILLAGAAPAIVRADSLMRVIPRETGLLHLESVNVEIMTATECVRRMEEALLAAAHRVANPPLVFDSIDWDEVVAKYADAFKAPPRKWFALE